MTRSLLSSPYAGSLDVLEEADHLVHILVPQIQLDVDVAPHGSFLAALCFVVYSGTQSAPGGFSPRLTYRPILAGWTSNKHSWATGIARRVGVFFSRCFCCCRCRAFASGIARRVSPLRLRSAGVVVLRRGFRYRLRRDASRKPWARGELRTQREMDNFSCSHRCTSYVRLGQGRVGVSSTAASRYLSSLLVSTASLSFDRDLCPSRSHPYNA
jgi:hypothetical protein